MSDSHVIQFDSGAKAEQFEREALGSKDGRAAVSPGNQEGQEGYSVPTISGPPSTTDTPAKARDSWYPYPKREEPQ